LLALPASLDHFIPPLGICILATLPPPPDYAFSRSGRRGDGDHDPQRDADVCFLPETLAFWRLISDEFQTDAPTGDATLDSAVQNIKSSWKRRPWEKIMKIKWLSKPQEHDYLAAESYLSLTLEPQAAKNVADELRRADMSEFAAKDIFRASGLSLLGISNSHVEKDRTRIILTEKLSPLLLFRDKNNDTLVIADGYHRLCAVYTFDENAMIPCKIV
jgi:hypothetical protein